MKKILKQKFVIIIFGPTAVGKSAFAEKLAGDLQQAQIVNCDLGQFYTNLSIGVAKPDYKSSKIKQHLFDIIDEPVNFTVSQYRELVINKINQIWQENDIPILVGGSGFYLKSLFFPPVTEQELGEISENIEGMANSLAGMPAVAEGESWWEYLYKIDPDRAKKIDKNDSYRIKRAIDLWEKTGRKPSELEPKFDFPSNFLCIFLNKDRELLYAQIDSRSDQMLQEGWITEVEKLICAKNSTKICAKNCIEWEEFLIKKKLIGYDLIINYIKNGFKFDLLVAQIRQKTRNYAKRQITFWKSLEKQLKKEVEKNKYTNKVESRIEEFNLVNGKDEKLACNLYIKQLLEYLWPLFE